MTVAWVAPNTGAVLRLTSDDGEGPHSGVAVGEPPEDGKQTWDFPTATWSAPPPAPPRPTTIDELIDALKAKGVLTDADLPRRKRADE